MRRLLVVDDEESIIYTLKAAFSEFEVDAYLRPGDALESIKAGRQYDVLLVDFRMQGMSGLDLLVEARQRLRSYKAILVTAFSSRELLEKGLNDELFCRVVNKPIDEDEIVALVKSTIGVLDKERLENDYRLNLEKQLTSIVMTSGDNRSIVIHSSDAMRAVVEKARKYAGSTANVLIEGESGVGKEVVASFIHRVSPRADKPMVKLNCSAIPEHLFEAELFGYKRGAFTGAAFDKPGKFQLANGGTLFLDEVGELPLNQQTKLLRAIEDFEISPLGSTEVEKVDVRVISATNKKLEEMVDQSKFRADLRFRLNILNLHISPLRERSEDIPLLATYFLAEVANREGGITKTMDREGVDLLTELEFPGNVRELRNLIHKAYVQTDGTTICKDEVLEAISGSIRKAPSLSGVSCTLAELERQYIGAQLERNGYHLTDTAKVLGMEISNFSRKLKSMGITARNKGKGLVQDASV